VVAAATLGVGATIWSHVSDDDNARRWRRCGETYGWIAALLGFLVLVVPTFLGMAKAITDNAATWIVAGITSGVLTTAAVRSIVKQAAAPVATMLAGLIVPLLTIAGLAVSAYYSIEFNWLNEDHWPSGWILFVAVLVVGWLVAWAFAPVNRVSLHPFYREQLSDAFELRMKSSGSVEAGRTELKALKRDKRTTTICAAANVMASPITPPGRGALSFTFSGGAVGIPTRKPTTRLEIPKNSKALCEALRGTRLLEKKNTADDSRSAEQTHQEQEESGFPLAAAVAVSGAAVSPGMGKMTRRSYEALLAVANIRLGVWLPNPLDPRLRNPSSKAEGSQASNPKRQGRQEPDSGALHRIGDFFIRGPRLLPYFYKELLGLHNILDHYLYVTDGGHWDNLGLVEALRVRPDEIIVFDSSGDPPGTYATLGEAKSLAEMELGVRIVLDTAPLSSHTERQEPTPDKKQRKLRSRRKNGRQGPGRPETCFISGTAFYEDPAGTCQITYCRALVTKDAPVDIAAFQAKHAAFPNHSTLKQLFDDETFEAYRALGFHSARSIVRARRDSTLLVPRDLLHRGSGVLDRPPGRQPEASARGSDRA
jgi:hypothetical protein